MRSGRTWVHEIASDGRTLGRVEALQPGDCTVTETAVLVAQLRALADDIEERHLPEVVEAGEVELDRGREEPSNVE